MTESEWLKPPPKDFGWALQQMKEGKIVCRIVWRDDACVFLIKGETIEYNAFQKLKNNACQAFNPPRDIGIEDHIDGKIAGKYITGWTFRDSDLLAEDWEIYEVEK